MIPILFYPALVGRVTSKRTSLFCSDFPVVRIRCVERVCVVCGENVWCVAGGGAAGGLQM